MAVHVYMSVEMWQHSPTKSARWLCLDHVVMIFFFDLVLEYLLFFVTGWVEIDTPETSANCVSALPTRELRRAVLEHPATIISLELVSTARAAIVQATRRGSAMVTVITVSEMLFVRATLTLAS